MLLKLPDDREMQNKPHEAQAKSRQPMKTQTFASQAFPRLIWGIQKRTTARDPSYF